VLCKNSNERTPQSVNREAFVAELGLIAEHFSRTCRRADFLIIKEAKRTRPRHANAGRSVFADQTRAAAGANSEIASQIHALAHGLDGSHT
jgi:hypothetical protein